MAKRQHVPLETYAANLRGIAAHVGRTYAGARTKPSLVFITPPPVDDAVRIREGAVRWGAEFDGLPERTNAVAGHYAAACRAVAAELGVPCVDAWTRFQAVPAWRETLLNDGLHFAPAGDEALFQALTECIDEKLPHLQWERVPYDLPEWFDIDAADPVRACVAHVALRSVAADLLRWRRAGQVIQALTPRAAGAHHTRGTASRLRDACTYVIHTRSSSSRLVRRRGVYYERRASLFLRSQPVSAPRAPCRTASVAMAASEAFGLVDYLNASPTAFHSVAESVRRLLAAGFCELSERQPWSVKPGGRYFFTRNASTLVAFAVGGRAAPGAGFVVVGAHTDSPCPKLKPISKAGPKARPLARCERAAGRRAALLKRLACPN